jgi:hypothetical protein
LRGLDVLSWIRSEVAALNRHRQRRTQPNKCRLTCTQSNAGAFEFVAPTLEMFRPQLVESNIAQV